MKQFFITGTSSGIGQSLAKAALANGDLVHGYSRRNNWEQANFYHHTIDFSKPGECTRLRFDVNPAAKEYILINNAGWLGEVKPLAEVSPENMALAQQINFVAPSILSAQFLKQTKGLSQKISILQISSGAAQYAVPGWSSYCSSKAALNMLARSIAAEYPQVRSLAIAPGIVDTPMQSEIRSLNPAHFTEKERFINYHKNGELSSSTAVSEKIMQVIYDKITPPDCVFSLNSL